MLRLSILIFVVCNHLIFSQPLTDVSQLSGNLTIDVQSNGQPMAGQSLSLWINGYDVLQNYVLEDIYFWPYLRIVSIKKGNNGNLDIAIYKPTERGQINRLVTSVLINKRSLPSFNGKVHLQICLSTANCLNRFLYFKKGRYVSISLTSNNVLLLNQEHEAVFE